MYCPRIAHSAALMALVLLAQAQDQVPLSEDFQCVHPPYRVHLVSSSPLVLYLEGFLAPEERGHVLGLGNGTFKHSAVAQNSSSAIHAVRASQSTSLRRSPVVECIEQRALSLQGLGISPSRLEPIQLVKYAPTQSYHFHTDWFTDEQHASASLGGNRVSSIFAYVQADGVSGGGTNFPFLEPKRAEWCKFVDCDEEYEAGVTFKPVEGNAVFWENMVDLGDGIRRGDERVLHAGLPVVSGEKVGMNIWLREGRLPDEFRGL